MVARLTDEQLRGIAASAPIMKRVCDEAIARGAEIVNAVLAEREACCAILASAEPNTKAQQLLVEIDELDVPEELDELIAALCVATADELAEYQALIRARGAAPAAPAKSQAIEPTRTDDDGNTNAGGSNE